MEIAIALVCGLSLGYWLGRFYGYLDGRKSGEAYAPLLLRAIALEQGRCPVCDRGAPESDASTI